MNERLTDPTTDRASRIVDATPPLEALVVDDDLGVLTVVKETFRAVDSVRIWTASSGHDAGIRATALTPAFMLLDFQLGDTTALQFLDWVSPAGILDNTYIVVMSGLPREEHHDALRARGVSTILRKPLHLSALRTELEALASNPHAALSYLR